MAVFAFTAQGNRETQKLACLRHHLKFFIPETIVSKICIIFIIYSHGIPATGCNFVALDRVKCC